MSPDRGRPRTVRKIRIAGRGRDEKDVRHLAQAFMDRARDEQAADQRRAEEEFQDESS